MKKNISFPPSDQLFFSKRMAFLLQAGISLEECLTICSTQSKKRYKELFSSLYRDIVQGMPLSTTLQKHIPKISPFFIALVVRGEETGTLSESFNAIVTEITKTLSFRKKLLSALLYPLCITVLTLILTAFLVFIIFPKIEPLFVSMNTPLPWSTRFLIMSSTFLIHYWWVLSLIIIILYGIFHALIRKNNHFITLRDHLLVHTPGIRNFVLYTNLISTTTMLGMMLQSGTTLLESLQHIFFRNTILENTFQTIKKNIEQGISFSEACAKTPHYFPSGTIEFIAISETSGRLADGLLYISLYLEQELDYKTKILTSLIEPLLMILMGLVIGFVALSMIMPMYGLSQSLSSVH